MAETKSYQIDGATAPINKDGIHDPANDAITAFQHPKEALAGFPRDAQGIIDWVKAMDKGLLIARPSKGGDGKMQVRDLDIIFKNTGDMPAVKFPHRPHTEQLSCGNCHPTPFAEKAGANKFVMNDIFAGKFCGVCHGKVAFPPTVNCIRCHNGGK